MQISNCFAVALAIVPIFTTAHGTREPKIYGRRTVAHSKARSIFGSTLADVLAVSPDNTYNTVQAANDKREVKRQNTDNQCGPGFPHCAAGYCCSEAGWCGTGVDYCFSPGCQYQYGPACPENITPAGSNTSTIPRPVLGQISYGGVGIYECTTPGTIALTFDDGPYIYTTKVLDVLDSYGAKATFFITGNNNAKGEIDIPANGYVSVIQRMHAENHQIASHTWTHLDLSLISSADRKNQMYKNEMALRNILGFIPTYMRPPYSSCTAESKCEADIKALGYHIIYFDVDTDDYDQDSPELTQNSKDWFKGNITADDASSADSEWLVISHDIHQQTAYNLTDYMLATLTTLGYRAVTVGECLGDQAENWYRSAPGASQATSTYVAPSAASKTTTSSIGGSSASKSSTSKITTQSSLLTPSALSSSAPAPATSSTTTTKSTTDGTCGGTDSYTCKGSIYGSCCSPNGWCGSTSDYCNSGCRPAFGVCLTVSAPPAVTPTAASLSGNCGGATGRTCEGSAFGDCCSVHGWCGSTPEYCLASNGCQAEFGTCG